MPPRNKRPGPPPKEAIDFFNRKGIKPGFDHRDVWKQEHSAAFTIAKVMEKDILLWARAITAVALEQGTDFREFAKDMKPLLDKSGWANYGGDKATVSRLRVIYDTNLRQARAAGQWERIERTKETQPYLVYELGPSIRHREAHESWQGTTLPVDHSWWDSHMPQNGYLCKCHVRQISKREATRNNIDVNNLTAPSTKVGGKTYKPGAKVDWKNERTGKTEKIPVGIDPGFNYNPGKDRMAGIERAEEGK